MLSFIIYREESSKVFPLVKKVTVFVLALFASILVRAQTDDDIAIFLENVRNEVPKIEDLDFYMSAGRRLLNESRMEEANVFFDFAASLGNEDGFRGKAASSKDNSMKQYYTVFAERNNPNADRLINSLAAADEDISAAILVHDNIATFRLDHLRDPLLDWMPTSPEDSAWLRQNDGIAYMIAKVKEDSGDKYNSLLLYEIAAWEGNYEALKKAKSFGTDKERRWKQALIDFMNQKKEAILFIKYLSGEEIKGSDYIIISPYLRSLDERLVEYSVAVPEPDEMMKALGIQPTGDYTVKFLREFVRDHPGAKYSKEAVAFIKKYYKENPRPWGDKILKIVKILPVDASRRYSRADNYYYPLYEKGLFSRLHHTQEIHPEKLDIGL